MPARLALYSAVDEVLTHYDVDMDGAELHARSRIRLPAMDEAFILRPTAAEPAGAAVRRIEPAAASGVDWHNERARMLLDLDQRLEACADDEARARLLASLEAAMRRSEPLTLVKA